MKRKRTLSRRAILGGFGATLALPFLEGLGGKTLAAGLKGKDPARFACFYIPGAISQYSLAEFDGDHLELTNRGLELARLENPVLDLGPELAAETLSQAERDFFLEQIRVFAPAELSDIGVLTEAVEAGSNTPDALMTAARAALPAEWSDLMARTQITGLVARMADMNLLKRHWEGRHVTYEVINRCSASPAPGVSE